MRRPLLSVRFPLLLLVPLLAGCVSDGAPGPNTPSVKPGINESFLDPKLDVDGLVRRFEGESREVYAKRAAILAACWIEPGMSVADIGAGTGMFCWPFAEAVGASGAVFAVDISQRLLGLIENRARRKRLRNIFPILGGADDVRLPESAIDIAFTCDTYHHFEHPAATLDSIHRALGPDGQLVVVDFERIPGVSRKWTLGHVRAGKATVREEIEAQGFEFVEEVDLGFDENYFIRFRKR